MSDKNKEIEELEGARTDLENAIAQHGDPTGKGRAALARINRQIKAALSGTSDDGEKRRAPPWLSAAAIPTTASGTSDRSGHGARLDELMGTGAWASEAPVGVSFDGVSQWFGVRGSARG